MELCTCTVVCCVCFSAKRSCSTCAQLKWSLNPLCFYNTVHAVSLYVQSLGKVFKNNCLGVLHKTRSSPFACALVISFFASLCLFHSRHCNLVQLLQATQGARPPPQHAAHLPWLLRQSWGATGVSSQRKTHQCSPQSASWHRKRCTECAIPWNALQQKRQHYNVYTRRKPTKCQNHKQNMSSGPLRYANSWVFSVIVNMNPVAITTLALLGDGGKFALLVEVTQYIHVYTCTVGWGRIENKA